MSNNLVVVTPDYDSPPGPTDILADSCKRNSLTLFKWGTGKKWTTGAQAKFVDLPEFIKTLDCKYVLMADSNDTFILDNEEKILDKYCIDLHDPDILLSVEANIFPLKVLKPWFDKLALPTFNVPWKYPNGGCWLGKRDKVIEMLEKGRDKCLVSCDYPKMIYACDQTLLQHTYLHYYTDDPNVKLDYTCHIFQNMFLSNQYMNAFGENLVTGTKPSLVHFNGSKIGYIEYYKNLLACGRL